MTIFSYSVLYVRFVLLTVNSDLFGLRKLRQVEMLYCLKTNICVKVLLSIKRKVEDIFVLFSQNKETHFSLISN